MRPALTSTDPIAISVTRAIHTGDVATLRQLLSDEPGLADARIVGADGVERSMVHVATDWPGHFPEVGATLRTLASAGADVNARMSPHPRDPNCVETPLHWAASSNDVVAIDALLDLGADIEAAGAIFTGGAPLSDAVVFANWEAARRLVERGARPTWWQGAALGMLELVITRWQVEPLPTPDEITRAFWHACRGAQRSTAAYLLAHGADPHWVGWDHKTPLQAAEGSRDAGFVSWLRSRL
ncbi:MAG: ankyrin repeat domain-containing protein [Acidobacteriota bacterium]